MLALLVVPVMIAALWAVMTGGDIQNLVSVRFRYLHLMVGAVCFFSAGLFAPDPGPIVGLVAAQSLLVCFLVASRSLGLVVAGAGVLCNEVAIALNGGMPVSVEAALDVGRAMPSDFPHEALASHSLLGGLGDVIRVPVLAGVISIGDVLIVLGLSLFIFRTVRGRQLVGSPERIR